jgi:hypothetical protein
MEWRRRARGGRETLFLIFSRSCVLLGLLVFCSAAAGRDSAGQARSEDGVMEGPRGPVRGYRLADHLRSEATSSVDIQGWEYTLETDAGDWFFVTGFCSRVWFMPSICGVEISWASPSTGREEVMGHRVPHDQFTQQSSPVLIQFGPRNWIRGLPGNGHRLHVETDWHVGLVLDVSFQDAWEGFVLGDGVFRLPGGEPLVQNAVGIPRARFEGSAVWGGDAEPIRGWASMQRMGASRLPTQALQRRQWVVSRHDEVSVIAMSFLTDAGLGSRTGGWLVAVHSGGVVFESRDVTVKWSRTRPVRNCLLPGAFLLKGVSGERQLRLGGEGWPPMQVFGMTDSLSSFLRTAIHAVMGTPVFSRLAGKSEARGGALGERSLPGSMIQRVECRDK